MIQSRAGYVHLQCVDEKNNLSTLSRARLPGYPVWGVYYSSDADQLIADTTKLYRIQGFQEYPGSYFSASKEQLRIAASHVSKRIEETRLFEIAKQERKVISSMKKCATMK